MQMQYILNADRTPMQEPDILKWAKWFEDLGEMVVAVTNLSTFGERVSTVFLGLDHNFLGDGPPILWETMILGIDGLDYQKRYTSEADAKIGHDEAVRIAHEFMRVGVK